MVGNARRLMAHLHYSKLRDALHVSSNVMQGGQLATVCLTKAMRIIITN